MWNLSLVDPVIVPIYGEPDAEGVRPIVGYDPRCHINLPLYTGRPALEPWRVTPLDPESGFAGMPGETPAETTLFLRFGDEAEALAILGAALPEALAAPMPA